MCVVSSKIFGGEDTAASSLVSASWKHLYDPEKAEERKVISGKHNNIVSSKSFVNLDIHYKTDKPPLLIVMNRLLNLFQSIPSV